MPAFASGRLAARTLARAQAGRVAKAVNRQPADGPEAAAPHKTQAAATRPAAASLALPFRRARPDLPARAPRLCHPRALPADDAWLISTSLRLWVLELEPVRASVTTCSATPAASRQSPLDPLRKGTLRLALVVGLVVVHPLLDQRPALAIPDR